VCGVAGITEVKDQLADFKKDVDKRFDQIDKRFDRHDILLGLGIASVFLALREPRRPPAM
jgi:hypothetical protein